MKSQERMKRIFNSQNFQELTERYDVWAKDYDADLEEMGRRIDDPSLRQ